MLSNASKLIIVLKVDFLILLKPKSLFSLNMLNLMRHWLFISSKGQCGPFSLGCLYWSPINISCCPFYGGGSVVVDFLFIVTPIVGVCNCSMFCCTLLYVHSSIAIILMGKRELVALLILSPWCWDG